MELVIGLFMFAVMAYIVLSFSFLVFLMFGMMLHLLFYVFIIWLAVRLIKYFWNL